LWRPRASVTAPAAATASHSRTAAFPASARGRGERARTSPIAHSEAGIRAGARSVTDHALAEKGGALAAQSGERNTLAGERSYAPRDGTTTNDALAQTRRALGPRSGKADTVSRSGESHDDLGERELAVLEWLRAHGASFFSAIHEGAGGGYPGETVDALWTLVWRGLITNDSWQALRAYVSGTEPQERRKRPISGGGRPFRSRRQVPPAGEGRWSLMEARVAAPVSPTEWSAAVAQQMLSRYGLITREVAAAESLPGGFSAIYDVLKALEDSGRIRRGYFVGGVGATQFALPAALDLLRSLRDRPEEADAVLLAATDPANPYGVMLKWPDQSASSASANESSGASDANTNAHETERSSHDGPGDRQGHGQAHVRSVRQSRSRGARVTTGAAARATDAAGRAAAATADAAGEAADGLARGSMRGPTRTVGAQVILVDGQLAAYLGRGRQLLVYLPDAEPERSRVARALAARLADIARTGEGRVGGLLIGEIDGAPAADHALAPFLVEAGFVSSALGFQILRERRLGSDHRRPGITRWPREQPASDADADADAGAAGE